MVRARRNFGTMAAEWQDRKTCPPESSTHNRGFHITLYDGHEFNHRGGCITIDKELIREHGKVIKCKELKT